MIVMAPKPGRRCFLCNSRPPTSMHMFPKDNTILSLWKNICNLEKYDDVSHLYICSNHFTPDDYLEPNAKEIGGKLRLKPGKYPSVSVPNRIDHCESEQPKTCSSTENTEVIENNIESSSIPECSNQLEVSSPKKRKFYEPRYLGDVVFSDYSTPRRAKRTVMLAKEQIRKQQLKIKALQQSNGRLRKKVSTLQDLIRHLQEND